MRVGAFVIWAVLFAALDAFASEPPRLYLDSNLSHQFPSPAENQLSIGSCHAFSAVALLEAALFRDGVSRKLSEADLFYQKVIAEGQGFGTFVQGGARVIVEGARTFSDIRLALRSGVAFATDYADFAKRYSLLKKSLLGVMGGEDAWLPACFGRSCFIDADRLDLNSIDFRARLVKWFAEQYPGAAVSRLRTRDMIRDFRVAERQFPSARPGDEPRKCFESGREAWELILNEIKNQNRPVEVSMHLNGLPAWGQKVPHSFLIVGLKVQAAGGIILETRNSWGPGKHHPVYPQDMCRIYRVTSVLTASEFRENPGSWRPEEWAPPAF